ncbi:von Willebrand factor A domain-containing protein 5A [Geodia barretti]|uniref:von Willebrand factor A domain-containing protein 5A n=1 Tax=Geodia barretti TaxID=519541 RepID=A0AA35SJ09_GEOBA|nr:von Willebrand factor A domain-containing protein 5A [Geodia barretti]
MAAKAEGGLLVAKGKAPLPLKSVSVDAQVRGFVMGLRSTLTYSNDSPDPVEVLFRFPVEKSHAVVGLTAVIDGRKIAAQVREKEEARAQYDDAIASGLSAALAEEKSGDIFSIALGNLPPGKDAQIQLQLVGELGVDAEGGVRFSLPSTLKPRYTPTGSTDPLAPVPAGEEEQVKSGTVSAVSWFHLTVEGADGVAVVTSPTHSITVTPNDANQLDVRLSKELDSDLVILVKTKEPHAPKAIVEGGEEKKGSFMSSTTVMLNFFPSFPEIEAACEFIFLVDRSGSMRGSYIKSARETLVLFLKSLPQGNYFNIMGFGSSYTSLFPNPVPYDKKHLEKAIKHAQGMEADLGGTELLRPLQHIFETKPRSGYARQVFVLTDGSVSNTDACIQEMRSNLKNARCFTFGIGSGASSALVNGLATAGNGAAEFVKEGERMQPKVIRSLKRALQPAITDVSVSYEVPKEFEVTQSPQSPPPVFNGEKLVVYATLKSQKALEKTDCTATLKGNMLGEELEYKIPFTFDSSASAPSLLVIHHLAAKSLITDWETARKEKKSIVDLSIESSVISSHTAFIAVDEESSEPVSGSMKVYDIQAPMEEYSCRFRGGGGGSGGAMQLYASLSLGATLGAPMMVQKKSKKGASPLRALFGRKNRLAAARSSSPEECFDVSVDRAMASDETYECDSIEGSVNPISKPTNTLEDLISAQQLDGTWELTSSFAQLTGKPLADLEAACPIGREGVGATVWATILAVSLLRSRYSNQQDEWELIAMKDRVVAEETEHPSGITLEKLFKMTQKQLIRVLLTIVLKIVANYLMMP